MNLQSRDISQITALLGNRRAKAMVVGGLILACVVVLQVGRINDRNEMCELLTDCPLRRVDIQRIQIALSQSGLTQFEIQDGTVLVPKPHHSEYLQAIADRNAIPFELLPDQDSIPSTNPFMTRSQQMAIERNAKKKQIQEMVVRLPFVEQAWLEMDVNGNRSAFQNGRQSAVISIRPQLHQTLMNQQIDTVRQIVTGAVADMTAEMVVVIDLSTGIAYRNLESVQMNNPAHEMYAQKAAFVRQQTIENRIRAALSRYEGLKVTVLVEASDPNDQIAETPSSNTSPRLIQKIPSHIGPGANGQASIYSDTTNSELETIHKLASAESTMKKAIKKGREKVSILIDVPEELLVQLYGSPSRDRSATSPSDVYKDVSTDANLESYFSQFQSEIERTIRPLLSADQEYAASMPVNFNLIRLAKPITNPWITRVQNFAEQNWPSLAVLMIGVVLISIITQTGKRIDNDWNVAPSVEQADEIAACCEPDNTRHRSEAEKRLSKLIENDAEAAAKVIENWIRDAA